MVPMAVQREGQGGGGRLVQAGCGGMRVVVRPLLRHGGGRMGSLSKKHYFGKLLCGCVVVCGGCGGRGVVVCGLCCKILCGSRGSWRMAWLAHADSGQYGIVFRPWANAQDIERLDIDPLLHIISHIDIRGRLGKGRGGTMVTINGVENRTMEL